ncbi:hypothetical protein, partial [Salmonella sp. S146_54837]|uniref:hypothetical protein n=1 Tax=Salmonella sp. S146_54837 TaxID=2665635 RepID=UPI0016594FDF
MLVDEGKKYIEVAKVFVNESIVTFNQTLIEYNITREGLDDAVVKYVNFMNATLMEMANWIEIAKDQPYDVTIEQIVDFANNTAVWALEMGKETFCQSVAVITEAIDSSIALWNMLISQENLDKIPVYAETVMNVMSNVAAQVNETVRDTILLTKKLIKYIKDDTKVVERLEE